MAEAKRDLGLAGQIHDEAFRARIASESVLEKLTGPKDGDKQPDPMEELLAALRELLTGQAVILKRLDTIERRIDSRPRASGAG